MYEVGLGNLGLHILYAILVWDVWAESHYARYRMEAELRRADICIRVKRWFGEFDGLVLPCSLDQPTIF